MLFPPDIYWRLVQDPGSPLDKYREGRHCQSKPSLLLSTFGFCEDKNFFDEQCFVLKQESWNLLSWFRHTNFVICQNEEITWQMLSPRETSASPRLILQNTWKSDFPTFVKKWSSRRGDLTLPWHPLLFNVNLGTEMNRRWWGYHHLYNRPL